jgi:CBS domain-containing protein
VVVGQLLALVLGLVGLLGGGIFLLLIAVFIFFGAQAEGTGESVQQVLGDLRVSQAVNTRIEYALPDQLIGDLAARLFHVYQEDFPVLDDMGTVIGVVTRDRLISALGQHGATHPVTEAMRTDFPVGRLDDTVYEAFVHMRGRSVKAMPVVDQGRLVGMVSLEDISEVYALLSAGGPELVRRVTAERGASQDGRSPGPVSYPPTP